MSQGFYLFPPLCSQKCQLHHGLFVHPALDLLFLTILSALLGAFRLVSPFLAFRFSFRTLKSRKKKWRKLEAEVGSCTCVTTTGGGGTIMFKDDGLTFLPPAWASFFSFLAGMMTKC
jgi:hypothetical protein